MTYLKGKKKKKTCGLTTVMVISVLLIFVGCKSKKGIELTPKERGSAKEIYDKAKARIKKNPEKARVLFKEIMHLFPDSPYARRAKIGIADSFFRQKDSASLIMAANEYQEYVNLFPNSPDAVYAKMQVGMCYYKQVRKPGRDQDNTHKAIEALEAMVRMYPDTEEAKDARKKITKARQSLATHYFLIGRTNFRLKAYRGALARFKQVIDDYPDFSKNDRLYYYTGKTYYAMKNYESAISFFQRVIGSFPKSKYLKKSRKMIEKINRNQSTETATAKGAKK